MRKWKGKGKGKGKLKKMTEEIMMNDVLSFIHSYDDHILNLISNINFLDNIISNLQINERDLESLKELIEIRKRWIYELGSRISMVFPND